MLIKIFNINITLSRRRVCRPPAPQLTLHADHCVHDDHEHDVSDGEGRPARQREGGRGTLLTENLLGIKHYFSKSMIIGYM